VITGLKGELAALKDQAKSSANSAGSASSPPDLQGPPEKQESLRWGWLREIRDLTKDVREIAQKCTAVQVDQIRRMAKSPSFPKACLHFEGSWMPSSS
jgi:hypothetical protein